jgi:hypothetical protein
MKNMLLLLITFFCVLNTYAQDPQTNAPEYVYPILDQYIREGFDRNYRSHTRKLTDLKYIYVGKLDTPEQDPHMIVYGDQITFTVYKIPSPLGRWVYVIEIHEMWVGNYYVTRRYLYKAIGFVMGLKECHDTCNHIMSAKHLYDPKLELHDRVSGNWEDELDTYYNEINLHITY